MRPDKHPLWCDVAVCRYGEAGGAHQSHGVRVVDGAASGAVWVEQRPGELAGVALAVAPSGWSAAGARELAAAIVQVAAGLDAVGVGR